jgi:hypothetical protein
LVRVHGQIEIRRCSISHLRLHRYCTSFRRQVPSSNIWLANPSQNLSIVFILDAINNKHVLLFQTDITGGAATATRLALSTGNKLRNATYPSGFQWDNSYAFGPATYPLKYSSKEMSILLTAIARTVFLFFPIRNQ